MVPLPAFVVKADSTCSALAAGGPQGPIVACHGEDHPINSEPVRLFYFEFGALVFGDHTPSRHMFQRKCREQIYQECFLEASARARLARFVIGLMTSSG
jgi:hypothetical protein